MPVTPAVSAVVVSYNTRDLLRVCLTSLRAVTLPLETIVVDNASADGSADAVRAGFLEARLISNGENLGFAKANNLGIRVAHAPYVLVLNSDAQVRPGAVETLARLLDARPEVAIVGPRTVSPDGTIQVSFGPDLTPWNEWRQRRLVQGVKAGRPDAVRAAEAAAAREHEPAWVSGSCFLARRAVLDKLSGFDEGFFLYEEDVDLCVRVRRAGHRVLFTPAAEVVHHLGRSMETARDRARLEYRRSHLRYYQKHNGPFWTALLRVWQTFR
jgi:GT2 family glycosyltransferase